MCVRTYSLSCEYAHTLFLVSHTHTIFNKSIQNIQNSLQTDVRTCMHPHTCVHTFMHLYIHQMNVQIVSCIHTNFMLRSVCVERHTDLRHRVVLCVCVCLCVCVFVHVCVSVLKTCTNTFCRCVVDGSG